LIADAFGRPLKQLEQVGLVIDQWRFAQVHAIKFKQIERTEQDLVFVGAAMHLLESDTPSSPHQTASPSIVAEMTFSAAIASTMRG
jgi:hypothetical protein